MTWSDASLVSIGSQPGSSPAEMTAVLRRRCGLWSAFITTGEGDAFPIGDYADRASAKEAVEAHFNPLLERRSA